MMNRNYKNKAKKPAKNKVKYIALKSFGYGREVYKIGDEVEVKNKKIIENWLKTRLIKEG